MKDEFIMNGQDFEPLVICPRCGKEVKNQEIGKAHIDGELAHVKCTQEELAEIGMDDFTGDS